MLLKIIILKIVFFISISQIYSQSIQKTSFECDTSIVISIDKKGELKRPQSAYGTRRKKRLKKK